MPRFIYLIALSFCVLFLFGNFQCVKEDACGLTFLVQDWQSHWLDNSGKQPVIAEDPVPRNAFGIRLFAHMTTESRDSLPMPETPPCFLTAFHPFRKIEMFATDGFDTVAAGADISTRFQVRYNYYSDLEYVTLDNASFYLNHPFKYEGEDYNIDLLMIEPPSQPGTYRFTVNIMFDSLATPLNRDTSFTFPTVQLQ